MFYASPLRDAALADLGVAMVPNYVVTEELAAGRLVRVLKRAKIPPVTANAIYPAVKNQLIAVRRLIDHLVNALKGRKSLKTVELQHKTAVPICPLWTKQAANFVRAEPKLSPPFRSYFAAHG